METGQQTTRKLLAFSAIVLLCGAMPHYWLDAPAPAPPPQIPRRFSTESLLSSTIGKFHLVNRWKLERGDGASEEGAMYEDAERRLMAQIDMLTNNHNPHNGLVCYITRGIPLQRQFTETVHAADSVGDFNIAFVRDESLASAGKANLLIATTECMAPGCTETPLRMSSDFEITWSDSIWRRGGNHNQYIVPLSVTLQLRKNPQDGWDQQQALAEFHELMSNFKLLPLRTLYASD